MLLGALLTVFILWMFGTNTGKAFRLGVMYVLLNAFIWLWCPIAIIYGAFFL